MILVDFNQVMISNFMMQLGGKPASIEPDLIRHMVLNSIRSYRTKYGKTYGDLVICSDTSNYWRKDIFPYYKIHRKKHREESIIDWNILFNILNDLRRDLAAYFPYKVIWIERLEADDIIGSLCHHFGRPLRNSTTEDILILSSDKDFGQLQCYANIFQFSPIQKHYVKISDPAKFVREHIIKGDAGDGIPNFLSPDDVFISDKRQRQIRKERLSVWGDPDIPPEQFCDENMLRGFRRNEALIDLSKIPEEIQQTVLEKFNKYKVNDRSQMLNYFIKNRLKNLTEVISDF